MDLDTDRERFIEHATGDVSETANGTENKPTIVRVGATLDVAVEPLAAYAALSGRREESSGPDGTPSSRSSPGATGHSFLLESAEKVASSDPAGAFAPATDAEAEHARYSFVGYDPAAVIAIEKGETAIDVLDDRYEGFVERDPGPGSDPVSDEGNDRTDGRDRPANGERRDTLDRLRAVLSGARLAGFRETDRQLLDGGLVGFLAYDAVYDLHLREVGLEAPDSPVPDAQFVLANKVVVFDHALERDAGTGPTVSLVFTPLVRPAEDPGAIYDAIVTEAERVESLLSGTKAVETGGFRRESERAGSRETYEAAVERAREHVLDGDIYQGVLSRTREYDGQVDPLGLYESLRAVNPSPYMYLLEGGDRAVVGASPETLLSVSGTEITANPIAGTCPRGASPVEDRRLAGEMLADGKERAEHTMLVDLARNDVRRASRSGSVRVPEFMNVLKYSHVQHIESTVTGQLRAGRDAFDAVRAAFPAGTLSGAPKIRAMEVIDALEKRPRGLYGGGVGYFSWDGDADLAIVIRTATIERDVNTRADSETDTGEVIDGEADVHAKGRGRDRISVQAGAGIVADSDPASEFDETERKMGGVLAALERIEPSRTAPGAGQ